MVKLQPQRSNIGLSSPCYSLITGIVCAVISLSAAKGFGASIGLVIAPKPQSYTDSCQSYGLALALAAMPNTPLKAGNTSELRQLEQEIRKARDSIAKNLKLTPLHHEVWRVVVETMTSGRFTVRREAHKQIADLFDRVAQITGVSDADKIGPAVSLLISKTAVMTSVKKIGKDNYEGGHIVTLYGIGGDKGKSPKILALNPAVKVGKQERLYCALDAVSGDERYQAQLALEDRYELKAFDDGYVLMYVTKKEK